MNRSVITIAVEAQSAFDRAAVSALIETLPGLRVIEPDAEPPHVLVWDAGSMLPEHLLKPPHFNSEVPMLLLLNHAGSLDRLPDVEGLFSKQDETPEALGIAIRQVARGEQYLSLPLALTLLERRQTETSPAGADLSSLSEREREVLALLAEGLSNKDIASRLYLSVRTVDGHLARLYTHLGVHSRTEAALIALQHHLTSIR